MFNFSGTWWYIDYNSARTDWDSGSLWRTLVVTLGSRWSVAVLILVSLQTSSELIFGRLAGRRLTVCWRRKTLTLRTVRFKASGRSRRKHQQTSGANQAASPCHFPFLYRFPVFPLTSSTVVTSVVFQVTSSLWVAVFKQRAGKKVKAGLLWFFFLSFCFIVVVKKVDGTNHHTARVQTRSEGTNKQTRTSLFVEAELQHV